MEKQEIEKDRRQKTEEKKRIQERDVMRLK